jgi:hypothetical protein
MSEGDKLINQFDNSMNGEGKPICRVHVVDNPQVQGITAV